MHQLRNLSSITGDLFAFSSELFKFVTYTQNQSKISQRVNNKVSLPMALKIIAEEVQNSFSSFKAAKEEIYYKVGITFKDVPFYIETTVETPRSPQSNSLIYDKSVERFEAPLVYVSDVDKFVKSFQEIKHRNYASDKDIQTFLITTLFSHSQLVTQGFNFDRSLGHEEPLLIQNFQDAFRDYKEALMDFSIINNDQGLLDIFDCIHQTFSLISRNLILEQALYSKLQFYMEHADDLSLDKLSNPANKCFSYSPLNKLLKRCKGFLIDLAASPQSQTINRGGDKTLLELVKGEMLTIFELAYKRSEKELNKKLLEVKNRDPFETIDFDLEDADPAGILYDGEKAVSLPELERSLAMLKLYSEELRDIQYKGNILDESFLSE